MGVVAGGAQGWCWEAPSPSPVSVEVTLCKVRLCYLLVVKLNTIIKSPFFLFSEIIFIYLRQKERKQARGTSRGRNGLPPEQGS